MGPETLGAAIAPKNRPKHNNAPCKEQIDDYHEIMIDKIIIPFFIPHLRRLHQQ